MKLDMVRNRQTLLLRFRSMLWRGWLLLVLLLLYSCHTESDSILLESFRYSNRQALPTISAHRGGKGIPNHPENCLETLNNLSRSTQAIYEIDVAQTKDGYLVLMHDNSLDRTTTGTGSIKNKNLSELEHLRLIDDFGKITPYGIPMFDDVLKWAKATNSVLTVDVKKSVSFERVISSINSNKASNNCIIITYSLDQSVEVYKLAPHLMMSVSARNQRELDALLKSGIPTKNMIAFTGTRLSSKDLYQQIHNQDMLTILGTLGNLDGRAEARGDDLYKAWRELGVDIIATDRVLAADKILNDR